LSAYDESYGTANDAAFAPTNISALGTAHETTDDAAFSTAFCTAFCTAIRATLL
jgi:hypothetical protein